MLLEGRNRRADDRVTAVSARKVADAILDRIVHNAHRIELDGPSMRKIEADKTAPPPLTRHKESDINRSPNGEDHARQIGALKKWPFWIGISGRFPVGIAGRFHRNAQAKLRREAQSPGAAFRRDAAHGNALSKLSRYETAIERSLFRSLHAFEQLQAARREREASAPEVGDAPDNLRQVGHLSSPHNGG